MTERNDKVMWGLVSKGSSIRNPFFQQGGCDMRQVLRDMFLSSVVVLCA